MTPFSCPSRVPCLRSLRDRRVLFLPSLPAEALHRSCFVACSASRAALPSWPCCHCHAAGEAEPRVALVAPLGSPRLRSFLDFAARVRRVFPCEVL